MRPVGQGRRGVNVKFILSRLGGHAFRDGISATRRGFGGGRLVIFLSMALHMPKQDITVEFLELIDAGIRPLTCARKPCHISCMDKDVLEYLENA